MAVRLTRREEFALVTLDRPEALNALSAATLSELAAAFDEAAQGGARALIITGAGEKAFCAGADIKEFGNHGIVAQKAASERGQALFARLDRLPILSIAAINGIAFGGGLELALACTFRIAARSARMGLPEIKLGIIPGYGGTQRLPRVVGSGRALELILSGRAVGAEEAERIGLVNRVVDGDVVGASIAFAREMTCHSLVALGFARDAIRAAGEVPLGEGLALEAQLGALSFQTEDAKEGTAAFVEKRKPVFRDR